MAHHIYEIEYPVGSFDATLQVECEDVPSEPDVGITGGLVVLSVRYNGEDVTDSVDVQDVERRLNEEYGDER